MKYAFSLILVLLLLPAMALAEGVPSKLVEDMAVFEVTTEQEAPDETNAFILPVLQETEVHVEILAVREQEIQKLAQSVSVEEYFGEVKNADGAVMSLADMLDTEEVACFEFLPVYAGGFDGEHTDVKLKLQFATPYQPGEKALVLIGFVTENGVEWIVYEASVDEEGYIITEFDVETVLNIQNNKALMAVVSQKK